MQGIQPDQEDPRCGKAQSHRTLLRLSPAMPGLGKLRGSPGQGGGLVLPSRSESASPPGKRREKREKGAQRGSPPHCHPRPPALPKSVCGAMPGRLHAPSLPSARGVPNGQNAATDFVPPRKLLRGKCGKHFKNTTATGGAALAGLRAGRVSGPCVGRRFASEPGGLIRCALGSVPEHMDLFPFGTTSLRRIKRLILSAPGEGRAGERGWGRKSNTPQSANPPFNCSLNKKCPRSHLPGLSRSPGCAGTRCLTERLYRATSACRHFPRSFGLPRRRLPVPSPADQAQGFAPGSQWWTTQGGCAGPDTHWGSARCAGAGWLSWSF